MRLTYTIYLLAASWQDFRHHKISVWLYTFFGVVGLVENFLFRQTRWGEAAAALIPGMILLLLTKCSRGAIGAGDGWFFIASAVYLGFWNTMALLFYGLMFCSACCMGMVVWGFASGVNVRKMRLPFLPFLLPAWVCITLL